MFKNSFIRSCVVLWLLLSAVAIEAQQQPTSQVVSFAGTIPGQADGPVALRLRLYDVETAGAPLFEETQTVTVTAEKFTVRIGDATVGGIPALVFRNSPSLWIAFALDATPDTQIGGRTAITSGGYAHAAQSLTGPVVTSVNTLSGDVTLAGNPPITITPVENTLNFDLAANGINDSHIADGSLSPAKIAGTAATRGANIFNATQVINPGNLGIGTTSPQARQHTVGTSWFTGDSTPLNPSAGTGVAIGFGTAGYVFAFDYATFTPRNLWINHGGGTVGIGTANPVSTARLHVVGGNGVDGVRGESTNNTGVRGESTSGPGVLGSSNSGTGVSAFSNSGIGVLGSGGNFGVVSAGRLGVSVLDTGGTTPLCRNPSTAAIATCPSSLRYKTDVRPFLGGLDIVNRLRPIAFTWKQGGMRGIGLAAEEVEKVEPLLTFRNDKGEIEGVKYNELSAVFVNAFAEQQAEIKSQHELVVQQQSQIEALQTANAEMREKVAALEKLVERNR